jgi:acetyl esterase/lipase
VSLSWLSDWLGRCSRDIGVELELTLDREAVEPDGEVVLLPGTPQDVAVAAGPVPRVWVDLADSRRRLQTTLPGGEPLIRGRGIDGIRCAARQLLGLLEWPPEVVGYGELADQFAFVRVPREQRPPHPVAVLVHGGFWRERWTMDTIEPLAIDLAKRGFVSWNLEYRRVGPSGGGWPQTQEDVTAALDRLAQEARTVVDLMRVVLIGHSAGGQLALAATARPLSVVPRLVVSLAGVLDLALCAERGLGDMGNAVVDFLGMYPDAPNEAYAVASPIELVPIHVRQLIAQGLADSPDLVEINRRYAERCTTHGQAVDRLETDGDHFALIDPTSADWQAIVQRITAAVDLREHVRGPS